ncbi:hypothetical protein [Lacihabitans sp. LS3-19]|uniref:hypothetical protein n=1 Tax=Lacihabitans sp. LS3-19 TaxID=2487335 RepID=UPI0020CD66A1|nr:hypothetical protein [Lacihabitans sp. LS3-19]
MIKYKVHLFAFILILLSSCKDIFPNKNIASFKVENESESEIEWVKIYLQDTEDNSFKILKKLNDVLSISNISSNSKTEYARINLKDFSETGKGFYVIKYKLVNSSDTLNANGGIRYLEYKCVNDISFAGKYYSNCIIKIEESNNKIPMVSYYLSFN